MADPSLERQLQDHLPALRAFLHGRMDRLVRSRETADDLVQSVCREVVQHLDRFEHGGDEGFRKWLFQMAERKAIDRFRYHSAERRHPDREERDPARLEAGLRDAARRLFPTPSRDAMAREELGRAQRAFEGLPRHYREVIVLFHLQGCGHAEIARRMGRTQGAVRNMLYRGLALISEALDEGAARAS